MFKNGDTVKSTSSGIYMYVGPDPHPSVTARSIVMTQDGRCLSIINDNLTLVPPKQKLKIAIGKSYTGKLYCSCLNTGDHSELYETLIKQMKDAGEFVEEIEYEEK